MKIAILSGGRSPEHEISIITALDIYQKLDKAYFLYLTKNNELYYYKKPSIDKILKNKGKKITFKKHKVGNIRLDLIVMATHGKYAEDGHLSAILDFYEIPYLGSNMEASCLGMDKELTDLLLRHNNITTVNKKSYFKGDYIEIDNYPVIIKPARSGSSLGISVVKKEEDLGKALNLAYLYDEKIIVETYLPNAVEYAMALYKTEEIKFSKIEIVQSNHEFFDYNEKYKSRRKGKNHFYLDDINKVKELEEIGALIYKIFELEGIVRIDFLEQNGVLYVNEINTIPGSLSNHMFDNFENVINRLIKSKLYDIKKQIIKKESISEDILYLNSKNK